MIHGGQLVARQLKSEGVRHLFTLTGNHISPIFDGCIKEGGIALVDFRHEQAAVYAADAYARLTRRPGVAAVTSGPGVTNAITGMANAAANDSPLVVLGGRTPLILQDMGALQECPQLEMVRPVCRYATTIFDATRIPDLVHHAFTRAATPPGGPAFVELPLDVLMTQLGGGDLAPCEAQRPTHGTSADHDALVAAALLIDAAARPVVIAGSAAYWAQAEEELIALAEHTGAPVYCSGLARGLVPAAHAQHFKLSRRRALKDCDVLVLLGVEFDFRLDYGLDATINPGAKIVQVHPDPTKIGKNRSVSVGVACDIRSFLRELTAGGRYLKQSGRRKSTWPASLRSEERARAGKLEELAPQDAVTIHPVHVFRALREVLDEDSVLIADGGDFANIAAKTLDPVRPSRWLDPGPFGCIGYGMPAAIAANVALPHCTTIGLFGDGAFGFSGFELDTAVRQNRRFLAVIGNDGAWGEMSVAHRKLFPGSEMPDIQFLSQNTRYDRISKSFGAYAERIARPSELPAAIRRALGARGPAVLDVVLDPRYRKSRRVRKRSIAADVSEPAILG